LKINSTYYLFIDEVTFDEGDTGNTLYFKSKDKKLVWNKMFKFIQKIDKENNPSKSTNIN